MAKIFQGPATLLHGLSDLWQRFFKDKDVLDAMYRGSEVLLGQAYLDLVSNVLNASIRETPVFNKELFRLLLIREDEITYDGDNDCWTYLLPDSVKSFDYLYNKIFAPSVILENEIHFWTDCTGENDELRFAANPFDWDGAGGIIPGVASRTVDVLQDDGTTLPQRRISLWAPDVLVDHYNLYLAYGHMLGRFEPSSESYRALLQGIMSYFVMGPSRMRVMSALNIVCGLSLIREEGEILQSVTTASGNRTVVTDKNSYVFNELIPLREDVLDTGNWGTLTFASFEYLTSVFIVRDWVSDPGWWYSTIIPDYVMPDEDLARRTVELILYENLVNNPPGRVRVGDPGFFIGADDDGSAPTGGRVAMRHSFAFVSFERFLKTHIFKVDPDMVVFAQGLLLYPRIDRDIGEVVVAGSSAYTLLLTVPEIGLTDSAILYELPVDVTLIPGIV